MMKIAYSQRNNMAKIRITQLDGSLPNIALMKLSQTR